MSSANALTLWVSRLDRRFYALAVGIVIGLAGAAVGLLVAMAGPLLALAALGGAVAGLYVITDEKVALYAVIGVVLLLPFGIFPVKIALTPTLLDIALAGFLLVLVLQWMTGRRGSPRLSAAHAPLALYVMWLVFAFALGMRHASPSATTIRQFAETLLSIGMVFFLPDILRHPAQLRRLLLVIMLALGAQALLAIGLFLAPDSLAEALLLRLSRIGYPAGGIIRYIESNPALAERAIGTWVDPNALGGILATGAILIAPQVAARKPVLGWRWLSLGVFLLATVALLLTASRASFLACACGLLLIAMLRYRRLLPLLLVAALLFLLLPQTQGYIERLLQAFQGVDLATQMRIGEWTDSLRLISRYPLVGVGFTGTPEINLYTDVANMYLIMANQIGLTGVGIFLLAMLAVFVQGARAWRGDSGEASIHLGLHAALFAGLVNAVADLYFFRLDFQASITWFWLLVALCLAASQAIEKPAAERGNPILQS